MANALLRFAVVVRVSPVARRNRSLHPNIRNFPVDLKFGNAQRSGPAPKCIAAALIRFGLPEQRQNILPSPSNVAHLPPTVVVLRLTPHIQKPVY